MGPGSIYDPLIPASFSSLFFLFWFISLFRPLSPFQRGGPWWWHFLHLPHLSPHTFVQAIVSVVSAVESSVVVVSFGATVVVGLVVPALLP